MLGETPLKPALDILNGVLLLLALAVAVWIGVTSGSWLLGIIAAVLGLAVCGGVGGSLVYLLGYSHRGAKRFGEP